MYVVSNPVSLLAAIGIALCAASSGCALPPTSVAPGDVELIDEELSAPARARGLAKLAATFDPGEQPPLRDRMTPGVARMLPAEAGPVNDTLIAEVLREWEALPSDTPYLHRVPQQLAIARMTLMVEGSLMRGDGDRRTQLLALERLYAALDQPAMSSPRSIGNALLSDALAVPPEDPDEKQAQLDGVEMLELTIDALRRTGPLHRRAAAQILCEYPDDPAIVDVLDRLGDAMAVHDGDGELAIEVRAWSVRLRGAAATASQQLALASACYRAFAIARGDRAVAAARSSASAEQWRTSFDETALVRSRARRALALAEATSVPDRLAHAGLMADLMHIEQAERELSALADDHPDDARVRLGRARHVIVEAGNYEAAYSIVVATPPPLQHRDLDWHQLAFAVRAVHLYAACVRECPDRFAGFVADAAPELAALREDLAALDALGFARAKALRLVLELVEQAAPLAVGGRNHELFALARGVLPRALVVLDAQPGDALAYRGALAAAAMSDDPALARSVLARPLPDDPDGSLAVLRIQMGIALAVTGPDHSRMAALVEAIDALPSTTAAALRTELHADVELIAWRHGDAAAGERALRRYTELAEGDAPDVRVLENLAVLRADDIAASRALWERIVEQYPGDADAARLQLAVSTSPPDLEEVERLAGAGDGETRRVALGWLGELSPTAAARRRWRAAVRAERGGAVLGEVGSAVLPGEAGLGLRSEAGLGVGYGIERGLLIEPYAIRRPRAFMIPAASARLRGAIAACDHCSTAVPPRGYRAFRSG